MYYIKKNQPFLYSMRALSRNAKFTQICHECLWVLRFIGANFFPHLHKHSMPFLYAMNRFKKCKIHTNSGAEILRNSRAEIQPDLGAEIHPNSVADIHTH